MSGGGGGGQQTGTQVTRVEPPLFARGALSDLVSNIQTAFQRGQLQAPQIEPVIQGFDPIEQAAQAQALEAATAQGQLGAGAAASLQDILALPGNITQRPEVQQAIQTAQRPVFEALTQTTLPAIEGGAIAAGQTGGSRQGIAEGLAIQGAQTTAGDIGATIASRALSDAIQARGQALFAAPQISGLLADPARTTATVGRDIRELTQAQAQEQQLIQQQNALAQFDALSRYAQLLSPAVGGFQQQTTQTTQRGGGISGGQRTAGGALAGAGVGAQVGGPYGALIGALLGGIASR